MSLIQGFYVFMTSLFTALMIVPLLCRCGGDAGIIVIPAGRRVHTKAILRAGGIAIGAGFLFSLMIYVDLNQEIRGILAGGIVLFFAGLVDDFYELSPRKKLLAEIVGCLTAMAVGRLCIQNLGDLFGLGPVVLPLWLAVPFTVLAVVGVINAINLIDGLDGLAGGVSMIALSAFAIHCWLTGNSTALIVCVALLGGVIGFLKYNLFPARIFLGEAGSLGVGFVLAFLAISITQSPVNPVSPAVPVIILGVPLMDAVWVMVQPLIKRRNPFPSEIIQVHHKFLDLGFRHRITVRIVCVISFFWAVFTVVFREKPPIELFSVFISVSAFFHIVLNYFLRDRERLNKLKKAFSHAKCDVAFCRSAEGLSGGVSRGIVVLVLLFFVCAALLAHFVLIVRGYFSI